MEQQRFGKDRDLGRAVFQLPVVAQNHVFEQIAQLHREIGKRAELSGKHPDGDRDMAEQLALGGIAETALIAEFVNLADIVQHHAGDQQVQIDAGIMRRCRFRQPAKRQHMFQQAAAEGVMNGLGGRRDLVARRDIGIVKKRIEQARECDRSTGRKRCRAARHTSLRDRAGRRGRSRGNRPHDPARGASCEW